MSSYETKSPGLRYIGSPDFQKQTNQVLRSRSPFSSSVRIGGEPNIGQEFAKLISGMCRQSFQNVLEVSERIDLASSPL